MKKILIISGKGGTGKTTVAAALIRLFQAQAYADCDVDAPNLHLITPVEGEIERTPFRGSPKAAITAELCDGCGLCETACRFRAIGRNDGRYAVNELACEGCGVCVSVCPLGAAALRPDLAGAVSLYRGAQTFATATLRLGRGNSGKLVNAVKTKLDKAAPDAEIVILDGSPGVGCPVISSLSGVDLALIVTEPSMSGLSDLRRIANTAAILGVRTVVCINRFDVETDISQKIEAFCMEKKIRVVGRIPYDPLAAVAVNAGLSLAQGEGPSRDAMITLHRNLQSELAEGEGI